MALPLSNPTLQRPPRFAPSGAPSPRRLAVVPDLDPRSSAGGPAQLSGASVSRIPTRILFAIVITCLIGTWTVATNGAEYVSSVLGAESVFDVREVSDPAAYETFYTVRPGDTLWSIATELDSGKDVREVVGDLRRINGTDVVLQPGERLALPSYASRN